MGYENGFELDEFGNENGFEFGDEFESDPEFAGEYNESPLSELNELELATELLSVTNEAQMDEFMRNLFKKVGAVAKKAWNSPVGGFLRKGLAKLAPIAGTVLGGLVDGVELWVHDGRHAAPMGSTLLSTRGADVEVVLRVRPASRPNQAGVLPRLHHVDLISGQIQGPAPHRDTMVHPTAQLAAQWRASNGAGRAGWLEFRHRIPRVQGSFFLRVRGTNTAVQSPGMDALDVDPWRDLWFYTNPVMVLVAPA